MKLPKFAEVRKAVVVVAGFVAEAVASGLLHGTALTVAYYLLGLATVAGVYAAKNATPAKPA